MAGMNIVFHHSIKLQNSKAILFCLYKTIIYQFFTNMLASVIVINSITRVCNMPTAANIVWMQNIKKAYDFSIVVCNPQYVCAAKKSAPVVSFKKSSCGKASPSSEPYSQMEIIAEYLFLYTF